MIFLQGEIKSLVDGFKKIVSLMRRFLNSGYHGWVVQKGTTKIPVELSSLTFFRTLGMREKGGKEYQNSCFQLTVNALIKEASGSLSHEQYLIHLVLILEAKRSIDGFPNLLIMIWKA